jgi:hypothetical protein
MSKDEKKEPTFKQFEYGDLWLRCSNCGFEEVVEKGIKDGIQFVLPTTEEHKLKLGCSKCGVSLVMDYTESDEETIKEAEKSYEAWQKQQEEFAKKVEATEETVEEKLEELAEQEDALLQENKEEEPAQDDN